MKSFITCALLIGGALLANQASSAVATAAALQRCCPPPPIQMCPGGKIAEFNEKTKKYECKTPIAGS